MTNGVLNFSKMADKLNASMQKQRNQKLPRGYIVKSSN